MLRFILSTIFLLASAFPAAAEIMRYNTYETYSNPPTFAAYPSEAATPAASTFTALSLSVIYPGLVVVMTMMAYYFLRLMEPAGPHDHRAFVRRATVLSALWLLGFFPFLSSALGGFLFCLCSAACVGAWILIRRFSVGARLWERMMVFWTFFFFSIIAGALVTGHGDALASTLDGLWMAVWSITAALGPVLLILFNIGAAVLAFRIAGVKIGGPLPPATATRFKVFALLLGVLIADVFVTDARYRPMALVAAPLLALPSLAYFGVYWLVMRLPEDARRRVTPALFVLLNLFLVLLACVSAGASPRALLLASLELGLVVSLGLFLTLLAQSNARRLAKVAVFVTAFVALFVAAAFGLAFHLMAEGSKYAYLRAELLPFVLNGKMLAALLLCYGLGCRHILSRKSARPEKFALAGVLIFLMLLASLGARAVQPAVQGLDYDFTLASTPGNRHQAPTAIFRPAAKPDETPGSRTEESDDLCKLMPGCGQRH